MKRNTFDFGPTWPEVKTADISTEKFNILLADPPWRYERNAVQGAAEKHYNTMNIEDICALPVAGLAADDAVLFLWSTFPQISDALRVVKAWSFEFVTCAFVWIKLNKKSGTPFFGCGFWTRSNAEICLLARKGKPRRQSRSVHQLIISPVEAHSKKPDIVREKIVELMGDVPRIELFARERVPGWEAVGNEIDGRDIREVLNDMIAECVCYPDKQSGVMTP